MTEKKLWPDGVTWRVAPAHIFQEDNAPFVVMTNHKGCSPTFVSPIPADYCPNCGEERIEAQTIYDGRAAILKPKEATK